MGSEDGDDSTRNAPASVASDENFTQENENMISNLAGDSCGAAESHKAAGGRGDRDSSPRDAPPPRRSESSREPRRHRFNEKNSFLMENFRHDRSKIIKVKTFLCDSEFLLSKKQTTSVAAGSRGSKANLSAPPREVALPGARGELSGAGAAAGAAGAARGGRRRRRRRKRWLATADAAAGGVLVCGLGVASWRGLWGLMDLHPRAFRPWPSLLLGVGAHLLFALLRGPLQSRLGGDGGEAWRGRWRAGAARLYAWAFMAACVLQWRGMWAVWLERTGGGAPPASRAATAAMLAALAGLRCLRNLLAMPYVVAVDLPQHTFDFPTRFRKSSREPLLFVLDCLFSVVVVGSLVVFVWRGAWDMLDVYIFPEDVVWSAWGSFALGYGVAVLTFLLQPLARRACGRLDGAPRLLLADSFLLLSFLATINVWRSVWSLLDIYFLPDEPLLSNWITHGGCLALLMLLNCANSVLVRGVYIDAEEEGGRCVVFPCYYLRLFFQRERLKKRQRRLARAAGEVSPPEPPAPPEVAVCARPDEEPLKDEPPRDQ